jgi:hypothetical protein
MKAVWTDRERQNMIDALAKLTQEVDSLKKAKVG